jgi:hypothetical protein
MMPNRTAQVATSWPGADDPERYVDILTGLIDIAEQARGIHLR